MIGLVNGGALRLRAVSTTHPLSNEASHVKEGLEPDVRGR